MAITFQSKSHASVTMLDDVALKFLKAMGHSGTVPSAIRPDDIPGAIEKLRTLVESDTTTPPSDSDEISLRLRAGPLLDLLESALQNQDLVMWDKA